MRHLVSDVFEFVAETRALLLEPAVQGALVNTELSGDVANGAFPRQQRLAQQPTQFADDVSIPEGMQFARFLLKMVMQ